MMSELEYNGEASPAGTAGTPRPRTLRGYLMLGLAFVTCPCHLPILAVLFAGTGSGAYLKNNLALTGIALTGAFVASLVLGLRWIGSANKGPRK